MLRLATISLCALALVPAATAAAAVPTLPAALSCAKILTPAKVNSLVTGTTFTFAKLKFPNFHQGPMQCNYWDASPETGTNNDYQGELVVSYAKYDAKGLAKVWATYSNPTRKASGPFYPTGIGTRAIEWTEYIAWTKGPYFAQVWSNGSSLGSTPNGTSVTDLYAQIEKVARYIDAKLPKR
jgi:hypothetical protein